MAVSTELFTIDTRELKQLWQDIEKAPPIIQREMLVELEVSAHMVKTAYRRKARPHMKTGELDRSIDATQIGPMTWEVGSTNDYSWYLEGGTQKHMIPLEPKKVGDFPPFLHFFFEKIGMWVMKRQVEHPGTKAEIPLTNAYNEVMEPFSRKIGARLKKRLESIKEI